MNLRAQIDQQLAPLKQQITLWWQARNIRERWILAVGGTLAVIVFAYVGLWEPLVKQRAALEQELVELRETHAWMKQAAATIRARTDQSGTLAATDDRSLIGLVDRSARNAGMGEQLNRVQPQGDYGVQIWFERVAFDRLITWIDELEQSSGARVTALQVEATGASGLVDVRLNLEMAQ
ncbi:type II secretion system protein M [Thiohalophilus sp.]|uniref:type II secretion system protein M n=1 Tax=Thiohalophilus sp. TaxID=3028392 RepID=UPI002ACF071C|nr:type II secretion system protein M [Thiohalophilus sp.]MDZ7802477.1 type II secretion system protein M [Thiohalophilus sp.]